MVCLSEIPYFQLGLDLSTSGLSLILSLLVIYFIFKNSLFKVYSFKILTYISINDCIRSLVGIFESLLPYNHSACLIYGFLYNYIYLSNMIFALYLTFTIFQIVVAENFSFEKNHKYWVFSSVFGSAFVQALPFITNSYGMEGVICEILIDETGTYWRYFGLYTPGLFMLIIIIILSYKIYKKIRELNTITFTSIVFERGLIYAIIISIILFPFITIRLFQYFDNNCSAQNTVMIMNSLFILQGSFNAVAFFKNKTILNLFTHKKTRIRDSSQVLGSLLISFSSDIN